MILFPNCKINLGLRVLEKRTDGYHNLESIMVPVSWCDILEITPASQGSEGSFRLLGSDLGGCPPEKNLVIKAIRALENHLGTKLPPLDISLMKIIPDGAGLGGGSSDASFTLKGVNELLGLGLDNDTLAAVAAKVGADCPFFIYNRPMLVQGIGDILSPVDIPALEGKAIAIAKPQAESVSTRDAYAGITPAPLAPGTTLLSEINRLRHTEWQSSDVLVNDFEPCISALRPAVARYISIMKSKGAFYVAMSGSGSSVFGLFDDVRMAEEAVEAFSGASSFAGVLSF